MKQDNLAKAKKIVEKVIYVTVATTSSDGTPWNSPVFSAYDQNYNFYWGSYRNSQHSKNIQSNGKVFLVIYDSTAPAGTGEGVYVKAQARELEDSREIIFAHNLLQTRRKIPYWKIEQVKGNAPIRLYKAVPEKVWVNDSGDVNGNYIDKLNEIEFK